MLIVFDFETGGLTRQHPNTQLAAVALDDEYNETGHNAAKFDMPRLTDAGKRHGVFIPAEWHVLDTIQLAMWRAQITGKWPENLQLSTLCNYYGVEVAGAHDALSDCRMTAALIDKMTLRS